MSGRSPPILWNFYPTDQWHLKHRPSKHNTYRACFCAVNKSDSSQLCAEAHCSPSISPSPDGRGHEGQSFTSWKGFTSWKSYIVTNSLESNYPKISKNGPKRYSSSCFVGAPKDVFILPIYLSISLYCHSLRPRGHSRQDILNMNTLVFGTRVRTRRLSPTQRTPWRIADNYM